MKVSNIRKSQKIILFNDRKSICLLPVNLDVLLKGALSRPRYVFATESSLKIIKDAFCFTSKALFVLKVINFLF